MRIEGSVRANMLAAIASARRWRGQSVHHDTIDHWRRMLDHGRRCSSQPDEVLADVVAALETELASAGRLKTRNPAQTGTAQPVNRSSGMAYHSDRPADQLKREARHFQETLRRALAKPVKPTKD